MSIKADIKAKMQAMLTLNVGITDRSEHEEVLHTDIDSILENIYPTPVNENSGGTHVLTIPNTDFSYDCTFTKIGRQIHVTGTFTSTITATSPPTTIRVFAIELGEYDTLNTCYGIAHNTSNGNVLSIFANTNFIYIIGTVTVGEEYNFIITYNSVA